MTDKQHFDFLVKAGVKKPEDDIDYLYKKTNQLLDALFIPVADTTKCKLDKDRCGKLGVNIEEPANWGGLGVADIEKRGENYIIILDEAMPDSCPSLCCYVMKHLTAWGWPIFSVETEW